MANPLRLLKGAISRLWEWGKAPSPTDAYYETLIPVFPFERGVPHVLYNTYHRDHLPEELERNVDHLLELNPGWSYKLYDDDALRSYVVEHYGSEVYSYVERIGDGYGAAKADLFRYLLIYREGGVYLDVKSSISRPLGDILLESDGMLVSYWDKLPGEMELAPMVSPDTPRGLLMQWFVVSSPGNPMLRQIILECLRRIDAYNPVRDSVGADAVFRLTGPSVFTDVVLHYRECLSEYFRFIYFIQNGGGYLYRL